jgi:hypothetical protein
MNEAKRYNEMDMPPIVAAEVGPSKANSAERLAPLFDTVVERVDISNKPENLAVAQTEEVLHGVIEAAEHNQAIEKLFELSHEVKDQQSPSSATGQQTSSIGQLLESRNQTYNSTARKSVEAIQTNWLKHILTDNSLYGHAIRYGFVGAVLSLLTAILIVTLFT